MKIKQRPEDFSVVESYRFEDSPDGDYFVYRMDKQKLTTLDAVERLRVRFHIKRQDVSFCGLKDKQGRTEQLIAVHGKQVEMQEPDLRLTLMGRSDTPLSAKNIASNRFSVIVRDLSAQEAAHIPDSVAEVARVGVVNYFDSQRFGFVKHGQGFIIKDLIRGDLQAALKSLIAHPSELDQSDDAKVKQWFADHWGEWDSHPPWAAWLKYKPMVQRLRDKPFDFGGALATLDRRLRAMVVFEFQSALWNDAVCRLMRRAAKERDLVTLRYQLGTLVFPRTVPQTMQEGWRRLTFPLLAPETKFTNADVQLACEHALEREHMKLADLKVEKLPLFHFKHEERPLLVFPGTLRSSEPKPDESNRGRQKVVLSFTLPPGAYATLVVRRVCWFATKEHTDTPETPRQRGKPARRSAELRLPLAPSISATPAIPAIPAAPPTPPPPPAPRVKSPGYLERARLKKANRAQARSGQPPRGE